MSVSSTVFTNFDLFIMCTQSTYYLILFEGARKETTMGPTVVSVGGDNVSIITHIMVVG